MILIIFKLDIDNKEIEIRNRFSLIQGKFNEDILNQIQDLDLFSIIKDFKVIPIISFVKIFKNQYKDIDKSLEMLEMLIKFRSITKYNINIIDLYNGLILSYISILKYNSFIKEKETLLEQQKILKKINSMSESTEIIEKLKKLNDSTILSKQNLKYFEEDYFKERNRINEIKKAIDNYNIKIKNLEGFKKECINQIGKIMEEMDEYPIKNEKKTNNLSYSKRFQELNKQAKNFQYKIKKTSEKLNNVRLELEKYTRFDILELNYQDLLNHLNTDKNKQNEIKKELGNKLNENLDKFRISDLLKSTEEINKQIQKIEDEMYSIRKSNQFLNINHPNNILKIKEEFKSLQNKISDNQEINTLLKETETIECIENFKKIENLILNLEKLLNNFLLQIYLKLEIETMISQDNKNIKFQLNFFQVRKKTTLSFNELTTPEKVFFVIVFYISIKIMLNFKNIIFSNILLPTTYNKRGSIFRTLRKIIPVFERENNLKSFNLIFILSNLAMKEQIKNLNVLTI